MPAQSVNEVHLIGHAGKDGEVKYTSTGKALGKFTMATGGGRKQDGSQYPTDWHRITAWGDDLATLVGVISKGDLVEVFGRISYGSYDKGGQKVYTTDIVAQKIVLPDSGRSERRAE